MKKKSEMEDEKRKRDIEHMSIHGPREELWKRVLKCLKMQVSPF